MKLTVGYIIKNINTHNYTIVVPILKKYSKYNKIQLNIQKNYFYDKRREVANNFMALIKFDPQQKKYNLIKILT